MALLRLILWIWQLPQNLLGWILVLILKPESCWYNDVAKLHFSTRMRGGVSLGKYIIIRTGLGMEVFTTIRHESGHSKQSLYLGWLYLLVIGLPSLLWATIYKESWKCSYYDFYTEKWADKLGGVKR